MPHPESLMAKSGLIAVFGILILAVSVLFMDLVRFKDPVGEKFLSYMEPGGADFYLPFNGAKALLMGVNPYTHQISDLDDKWGRDQELHEGVRYKQFNSPSHLLLYVPLAFFSSGDVRKASAAWFYLSFIFLIGLSWAIWKICDFFIILRLDRDWGLLIASLILLALNTGTALGLERGQADIFLALLCWWSVYHAIKGQDFTAVFLAFSSAFIKGYAMLFAIALCALLIRKSNWKPILAGFLLAFVIFVLPVFNYLEEGRNGVGLRLSLFWNTWFNHGFKNLVYSFAPNYAETGRIVLTIFGLGTTGLVVLFGRIGNSLPELKPRSPLLILLLALCSLGTVIGYAPLSIDYNLILLLPGLLIGLLLNKKIQEFFSSFAFCKNQTVMGLWASFLLLAFWIPSGINQTWSTSSFGLLSLIVLIFCYVSFALYKVVLNIGEYGK